MLERIDQLWVTIKKAWGYLFDSRIPIIYKLVPFIVVLYLIYPFDFLADTIPFLGQADDITLLGLGIAYFVRISEIKLEK